MAFRQLSSLVDGLQGLRSPRAFGALAFGSVAGTLIAAIGIPNGGGYGVEEFTAATEVSQPIVEEVLLETTVPEVIEPEPFDRGGCPPDARACVDLDGQRAWLQENGEVSYGAVPIGKGGPGYLTPRDAFHISRKVEFDVSLAFDNAPMPFLCTSLTGGTPSMKVIRKATPMAVSDCRKA